MAYKARIWDGSEWVPVSSDITDTSVFATQDDLSTAVNEIVGDSDQFIIPMQVFR
jgi:hypothetical protein